MSIQLTHSKIVVKVGRATLRPLGFIQKGSSRVFYSDEGYWTCVVEFQPHKWLRGSFLNVSAHWLWSQSGFSFDFGAGPDGHARIAGFHEAKDDIEFEQSAHELASTAAKYATNLRMLFPNVNAVASVLMEKERAYTNGACWSTYHCAIALGLSGRMSESRMLINTLIAQPATYDWQTARQIKAKLLRDRLDDPGQFKALVGTWISDARQQLKLVEFPEVAQSFSAIQPVAT
jgi:hypothetical protein